MIRFVVAPDRSVVADLTSRLPGRGIWLSVGADVLQAARADADNAVRLTRAFARAARGPVSVPADLSAHLCDLLARRIEELLGLARRAGQAMAGFEKAKEWLRSGRVRLVLQASDGSAAEKTRFTVGIPADIAVFDPLPGSAMGRLFGRDFVVHVAIAPGKLAEALVQEAGRLAELTGRAVADVGQSVAPVNLEVGTSG